MKSAKIDFQGAIAQSQNLLAQLQADQKGFRLLADLLKAKAGINMIPSEKNLTLMASRVSSVLKKHGIEGYSEYIKCLNSSPAKYLSEFIFTMTTNTTQFFRESAHFDFLQANFKKILAEKAKRHEYEIRIWCSATSTGQEVYTLLMVILAQISNLEKWQIRFLASDIDHRVLEKAAAGIYQESDLNEIPNQFHQQFFEHIQREDRTEVQIKAKYRNLVRFAPFNLLTEKYPFQHPFDIIFCRNVLIYFDRPTAEGVVEKLAQALRPEGLLFLGHSETGFMKSKLVKSLKAGVYQKLGQSRSDSHE